ncbi:MAG: CDF family Co(II)/Ni(II) efflux transporter DmeF [Alphaproteobacteria bacterium]
MHIHILDRLTHDHIFLGRTHRHNERRLWWVVAITAITMIVEVVAGLLFNSMALLADGWHMATHAGALAISAFAYWYARHHAEDRRFTFGTGKVGELAAYTSALILAAVAIFIGWESVLRLATPLAISFDRALLVAGIGFVVNLVCAGLLWVREDSHRDHSHNYDPHFHQHSRGSAKTHDHKIGISASGSPVDRNMQTAFLHVLADAMTSVLAITALGVGRFYGNLAWLDPAVGLLGAAIIAKWSWDSLRGTTRILLDAEADHGLATKIRDIIEDNSNDRIADLHLWRIGPNHFAATISIITDRLVTPSIFHKALAPLEDLVHVTVEIHPCTENCGSRSKD